MLDQRGFGERTSHEPAPSAPPPTAGKPRASFIELDGRVFSSSRAHTAAHKNSSLRPSNITSPHRSMKITIMSPLRCLVIMSAVLSQPGTWFSRASFWRWIACTDKYRACRYRTFPAPSLSAMPRQA
eukprot:7429988-Pyramimonas_sp.AAC.1